jgi:hypothetical protein
MNQNRTSFCTLYAPDFRSLSRGVFSGAEMLGARPSWSGPLIFMDGIKLLNLSNLSTLSTLRNLLKLLKNINLFFLTCNIWYVIFEPLKIQDSRKGERPEENQKECVRRKFMVKARLGLRHGPPAGLDRENTYRLNVFDRAKILEGISRPFCFLSCGARLPEPKRPIPCRSCPILTFKGLS